METLCFEGYYTRRLARSREFIHRHVEDELDKKFSEFCNQMLQEEFAIQSGAEWYERSQERVDRRNGHYRRRLVTGRGVVDLKVPRGERKNYKYTLFEKNQRKTSKFDEIVVDALLKGHSSRKASKFFENMFGAGTISHQAAVSALKKFDVELARWKREKVENKPVILVLDAVHLKGVIPHYKYAKPVLFAYAVYSDGREEVLDFELVCGESTNAYYRFCLNLYDRGLQDVELVVHDDNAAISEAVSLVWPKALDQQCVFHILKNLNKKLVDCKDKKAIMHYASWLYEAESEEEFYRWAQKFKNKWLKYQNHPAIKYFFKMIPKSIRYYQLPEKYWRIAKTSNRLERLFEELKRRIKVFRRFPNPASCKRWLYALLRELNKANLDYTLLESQHNS
jgi:transposase-like protein